jgi:hypothetical protein
MWVNGIAQGKKFLSVFWPSTFVVSPLGHRLDDLWGLCMTATSGKIMKRLLVSRSTSFSFPLLLCILLLMSQSLTSPPATPSPQPLMPSPPSPQTPSNSHTHTHIYIYRNL